MSSRLATYLISNQSQESLLSLEGTGIAKAPIPPQSSPSPTLPGTGYLHNMTCCQREKLYLLWGMLFHCFLQPYGASLGKKTKETRMRLLDKAQAEACEREDFTFTAQEMNVFADNPLTESLFTQASTDDLDRILLRFLRARKWVLLDAFEMLLEMLKWRSSFGVRELMFQGERRIKRALMEAGKNFFWKNDREGNLVCYVRSRLHDKNAQTLQESIDYTIYSIEMGRRLRSHDEQLVTVMFDLKDAPLASLDISSLQFMVGCFQSFYPEILAKCLIKDAPWIFTGFWRMVKPLLDPAVAAKIVFVKQSDLPDHIDPVCLPFAYGGVDPFAYEYMPPEADNYPAEASEASMDLMMQRIGVLKSGFVEVCRETYAIICRVEDPVVVEQMIAPVHTRRTEIKLQLQECYRVLDSMVLAKTFYHRIGVMDGEDRVDWSGYRPAAWREVRSSAPPVFPENTMGT